MTALNGNVPMLPALDAIVGESAPMRALRDYIATVGRTRLPVLIEGPTGAGKELVAAAIHDASGRRGAFVPFNVCAIGETMFEDAIFGHVRGAFTGAFSDMPGFLAEAHGGTVFLDEVSGLPQSMQVKLLRAFETGAFRPVGAKRDSRSDFRLVAATNEPLSRLVAMGQFRADFTHRVGAVRIVVPPLVDRLEDIPLLVRHFLGRAGCGHIVAGEDAITALQAHHWPGNVRELKHLVEWCASFSTGTLNAQMLRSTLEERADAGIACDRGVLELVRIRAVLDRSAWDIEAAASALGVHRATLYRRMKRLGIPAPRRVAS